ncbi:MAG: cell division ATP-binding protein FtsE [Candidatus Pacebacteria bacterium]|nr:cell division ATP-binding protein FtsE [Candidatus Paceibacterota bacterium]
MIYFDNVTKIYPDDTIALENVDLRIEPGEFVSIVGHSGAGKTTLIKLLLAEETPTDGRVLFESLDIHCLKGNEVCRLRRNIGTIFQDFRLISNKTIFENIAFAMEVAGRTDEEIREDVPHALELVGLTKKAWNFPNELSGGEQQRVAIARAIVNQPDILVADEPTGNLDPLNTHDIIQILKKINDLGTTVILTTHNKHIIDQLERRVITVENGKIIRDEISGKYIL